MMPIKLVAKGVTGAYGLAKEALADHDAKKESTDKAGSHLTVPSRSADHDISSDDASSVESDSDNEATLQLDEVQQIVGGENKKITQAESVDEIFTNFFKQHPVPPPSYSQSEGKLNLPVILPQRRPQSKERGFVRAYAPVLEDCGIDQAAFMDFIDGFGKAIKLHPLFHAFNLAVAAGVIATDIAVGPMIFVKLGAMVVHTSVEVGRRQYVKYESNKYLDDMNEKFFKPHGLYAVVMSYRPESADLVDTVDMNSNLVTSIASREVGSKHRFANSSGTTTRDIEIPESAPLIFPELDALPEGEKENMFKRAGKNLGNYFDQRAQAKFEKQNPNSKLNVAGQKKEYASRFTDPNHPANSGSLVALVTGGAINTQESDRQRAERRAMKRQRKDAKRVARGREPRYDQSGLNKKPKTGGLKGLMRKDVLYLMIVNYPSEAELKEVAQLAEQLKTQQSAGGFSR